MTFAVGDRVEWVDVVNDGSGSLTPVTVTGTVNYILTPGQYSVCCDQPVYGAVQGQKSISERQLSRSTRDVKTETRLTKLEAEMVALREQVASTAVPSAGGQGGHAFEKALLAEVERLRVQLREVSAAFAMLREAAEGISLVIVDDLPCIRGGGALASALAATPADLAMRDARLQGEALREVERLVAHKRLHLSSGDDALAAMTLLGIQLRAMADEIEKGGECPTSKE